MKAWDKAVKDATQIIKLKPKWEVGYDSRAYALGKLGKFAEALEDCDKAIDLAPRSPHSYFSRGLTHRRAKNYEKSRMDYDFAIELAPKNAATHNVMAWFYATVADPKFRDGKRAVDYAKTACELTDWKHANALDTYAAALAESGDFKEAVRWQEEAVRRCLSRDATYRKMQERVKLYQSSKALFEDE
jgi:tetratricopeptide (TPR) repeat protein